MRATITTSDPVKARHLKNIQEDFIIDYHTEKVGIPFPHGMKEMFKQRAEERDELLKHHKHPLAYVTTQGLRLSPLKLRRPYQSIGIHAKRDCWPYI